MFRAANGEPNFEEFDCSFILPNLLSNESYIDFATLFLIFFSDFF